MIINLISAKIIIENCYIACLLKSHYNFAMLLVPEKRERKKDNIGNKIANRHYSFVMILELLRE